MMVCQVGGPSNITGTSQFVYELASGWLWRGFAKLGVKATVVSTVMTVTSTLHWQLHC